MIKIDSFIVNKGSNSSSSSNGGGFANTITVQKELETHKLWGQNFNGTQDVDGDMTVNGNINVSGNVKATKGEITTIDSTTINNSGNIVNGGNLKTTNATVDNDLTVTNNANVTNDLTVGNSANVGTVNATNGNITNIKSNNITNTDTIKTKNLQVTGTAHFFNLIIDKIKSAGGAALFTPADGFDVDIVQDSENEVKLLWQCQDEDGKQRDNMWKVNDQALCMSFNKAKVGTTHNVSNKYYWALVTSVNPVNEPIVIDEVKYNYITLSKTIVDGVLNPEFGDSIVMCGYRGTDDNARQSAIYISAYSSLDEGLTAPLFAQYQGINDFNLQSHRKSYYDAVSAKFIGEFEATDGQNIIDIINNKIAESEASIKLDTNNIVLSVSANTKSITTVSKKVDDNKAATDTAIANTNNTITALTQTVKNNYSTLDQKADGIKATVSANTETITAQGTSISNLESGLTSTNSTITALTKTVKDNYSTIDQKADSISSTVSSHTQIIEGLDGRVTTNTENISKVKQTADGLTSTVSSMKDEIIGENRMPGLNGQGWSSNTIYNDAGNSFHCESTEWFQSHPIEDFNGDYTFSFDFWGGTTQIKILDFTQTYYDDGIYNQYVDFGTYTPCKILTTSSSVSNATLTNYATSGTSSTWTYTNTETITLKVGDNVAVRVTNSANNRYNSIYGTVSAINTSSKSVTVNAIALLDQPNTICTLSCPTDKKDGTGINSLHYDEKLGRYWIRFKETRGSAKTFVILFRNLSASNVGWISRLMLEESVEYPHKYNATGQASQSMIKQTANEILMSVNDTYLKIGDGNITLNGDTKVNGALTLTQTDQGFKLVGSDGITEIKPESIGTYDNFKAANTSTQNVVKTINVNGAKSDSDGILRFQGSLIIYLGDRKKGDFIKCKFNSLTADVTNAWDGSSFSKTFALSSSFSAKVMNQYNSAVIHDWNTVYSNREYSYTFDSDTTNARIYVTFSGNTLYSSWIGNYNVYQGGKPMPMPNAAVEANCTLTLPTTARMLIGYDGWGANFGNNKLVYCGKDGFIAKYGNNEFRITDAGISHNNMATTYTIIGSSSSSSPTTYTVQDPIDTVLCKSGYCKVIFPSNPYNGQRIKIYDKSSAESYINSNGKHVCRCDRRYDDRSIWTNQNLPDMVVRIYTYINDTWFEEYTG